MSTVRVSSKGQIVLPAALRHRLGLAAGASLQLEELSDGLNLTVLRAVPRVDLSTLAGMIKARAIGKARSLDDFDAAAMLAKSSS
jgi:antitoxin PrlF